MWDVLLDALIDSLKVLAVLVVVYIIIGLLESRMTDTLEKSKRWTPLIAVGLASLPQCGFSVVATDLYQKKHLTLGTLIGVYVATSDEALPILLANPDRALAALPLLGIKIAVGIASVYLIDLIFKKRKTETAIHVETCEEHEEEELIGCCNHTIAAKDKLKQYLLHPIVHSLKIFAYVLVINIAFGFLIYAIGEDSIVAFMERNRYVTPIFAVLVGLIPNCASSVILTDMFLVGGLQFGACVAGLCANAGLGLMLLFKKGGEIKNNLLVFGLLVAVSLVTGYAVSAVEWLAF